MSSIKFWLRITGTIFGLVAVLHFLRIITGIAIIIGDWMLPGWINLFGGIVATFLCLWLWRLSAGTK